MNDTEIFDLMKDPNCDYDDETLRKIVKWFRDLNQKQLEESIKPVRKRATKKKD